MTLPLAARNLLRNRRRSLATLLALAIGSLAILFFGGYSKNIAYSMETSYVRTGGHLQIQHKDYFLFGSGNPTAYSIGNYPALIARLQADPLLKSMVTVVSPTLEFGGIAGNFAQGLSRTVLGVGQVAADVEVMRRWNAYALPLESPPFLLAGEGVGREAAIIGVGVARVLQLCQDLAIADCPTPERHTAAPTTPGKKPTALPRDVADLSDLESQSAGAAAPQHQGASIELLAGHSNGAPNVARLKILKAEGQGFKEFDDVAVIMQLPLAQQLVFGRSPPRVTAIMVQLRSSAQLGKARARIQALLEADPATQQLTVLDYETLNPFYVQTIALFDTIFGFIFVLIGAIVLFTVGNTMSAAVVERTTEIGTLRAMGLRQSGVRQLFMIEGGLLGISGSVLGTVSALLLAAVVNRFNFTWLPPGSSEPLPLVITIWGETRMIVATFLGLLTIAIFSAWWPATRAARLRVVDSLRHT